jgi:hypothetical protein
VRVRQRFLALLAPDGPALDLAVFRITIAIFLAWNESVVLSDSIASLPPEARVAPIGVGWLVPLLPITPALVRAVRWILWAACLTGGVGWCARASFAVASMAAFYVMLAPQLTGAVFHDHHLLWFAVLLAASPCGDALSIDAWLARRRGKPLPTHGRAHGAAIRLAWIFLGCVFFFPGVHKLLTSGLAWVTSDNLRNQMWWKWAEDPTTEPSFRIDRHPQLLRVLAALTIGFELTFLPLVFANRWTRALAVLSALVFHQATDYFMGVRFTVLWVTYGVFVPWEAVLVRAMGRAMAVATGDDVAPSPRPSPVNGRGRDALLVAGVGGVLLCGVVSLGALGVTNGYPFACFPTFEWMPADTMPTLEIAIERADGTTEILDRALWRDVSPREWALEWSVAGVYDEFDAARAEAFFRSRVEQRPALAAATRDAVVIRFARVYVSVDPDHRFDVVRREPLGSMP